MRSPFLLAIDQGTTSTRAIIYDAEARSLACASLELTQFYPCPGWVEHDPEEIWLAVTKVVPEALAQAGIEANQLAAVGITNQRETSVLWERETGRPVGRAIVWQDRRTTDFCRQRQTDEPWLREKTGLVLDPYFSATKIRWLLENDTGLATRARNGKLAFGTIDSFLIWRLTGAAIHATDVTNASRTLLLNLHSAQWDEELCTYFGVPGALLPEIHPSASDFGTTRGLGFLPDGLPIAGVAGDQQASLFGQGGLGPGAAKCTYGTGAFFLQHTGHCPILSRHRLLSTLAATIDNQVQYALEGSIFVAGAAVQWLRDGLQLLETASDVESLAAKASNNSSIIFVPALTGLGAPHWVPEARGVLFGLTRGTKAADFAVAALEGVAYQVADLVEAAKADAGQPPEFLGVDGGMAANSRFLQMQADILGLPLIQAVQKEATALGAALLAGIHVGIWPDLEMVRQLTVQGRRFDAAWPDQQRRQQMAQWRKAVRAVIAFYSPDPTA